MSMAATFKLDKTLAEHGISQTQFAKDSRLSFATINRICTNATAQVSLKTLDRIMKAFFKRNIKATLSDIVEWKP